MSNIDQILKSLANCAGQAESVFTYPNGIGIFWAWRSYVESGDCAGAKRMEVELAEEIDRDAKTASENIISAQEGLLARMLNLRAQLQKARKGTILDKFRYRKPDAASLLKLKIVNEGFAPWRRRSRTRCPKAKTRKRPSNICKSSGQWRTRLSRRAAGAIPPSGARAPPTRPPRRPRSKLASFAIIFTDQPCGDMATTRFLPLDELPERVEDFTRAQRIGYVTYDFLRNFWDDDGDLDAAFLRATQNRRRRDKEKEAAAAGPDPLDQEVLGDKAPAGEAAP